MGDSKVGGDEGQGAVELPEGKMPCGLHVGSRQVLHLFRKLTRHEEGRKCKHRNAFIRDGGAEAAGLTPSQHPFGAATRQYMS